MKNTTNPSLLPEAAAKLSHARALLATIGTTPEELGAILLAEGIAQDFADPDCWEEGATLDEMADDFCEGSWDAARDDVRDASQFLTSN